MALSPNGAERINLYALVVYIPDPLAKFLDDLRRELVPGCMPRAHVTILPPRPLAADPDEAVEQARVVVADFAPFDIEIGDVEIFPTSDVIYLGLRKGEPELHAMYRALNGGPLAFHEAFPYHPHVTLAQNLERAQVAPLYEMARRRWAEFKHPRRLNAARAYFVQSKLDCTWVDLADFALGGVAVR
ncbi:MAG TPA: 2'-5' RNA ligase family protein [Bryobacteraceae bacterium]|nr:2'-5' RNA ligase family protein [Bryobacteraceae bacterium]